MGSEPDRPSRLGAILDLLPADAQVIVRGLEDEAKTLRITAEALEAQVRALGQLPVRKFSAPGEVLARRPTVQGAALETLEADGLIRNDDAQATDALKDEQELGDAKDEQDEEEDDAASGADDEDDEDDEGEDEDEDEGGVEVATDEAFGGVKPEEMAAVLEGAWLVEDNDNGKVII